MVNRIENKMDIPESCLIQIRTKYVNNHATIEIRHSDEGMTPNQDLFILCHAIASAIHQIRQIGECDKEDIIERCSSTIRDFLDGDDGDMKVFRLLEGE